MVGDRAVDITAAHRNGLDAAGVLWGHGSREELEAEQPRYLFSTPAELLCLAVSKDDATPASVSQEN
jgi:phosphoglycolate phosphatase